MRVGGGGRRRKYFILSTKSEIDFCSWSVKYENMNKRRSKAKTPIDGGVFCVNGRPIPPLFESLWVAKKMPTDHRSKQFYFPSEINSFRTDGN